LSTLLHAVCDSGNTKWQKLFQVFLMNYGK